MIPTELQKPLVATGLLSAVRDVIEAAVLAEREACAKVCDGLYKHDRKESGYDEGWNDALDVAEQAIRARGQSC